MVQLSAAKWDLADVQRECSAKPPPTARPATTRTATTALVVRVAIVPSGVDVQGVVQRDPDAGTRTGLQGAADAVAPELPAVLPGELDRLHHPAIGQGDLRPGGDVRAGLHDAVVPQRDADTRVGAEQAAPADADALPAAAGERPHDRRAAADVGAVVHDHAGRDPPLDHGGTQRAGVVVHESLVHDRRPGGEVG